MSYVIFLLRTSLKDFLHSGVVVRIMKLFTFMGIITNTTIIYFTLDTSKVTASRWAVLFFIENILVFIYLCVKFDSLPFWFYSRDEIKYNIISKITSDEKKIEDKNKKENLVK